MTASSTKKLSFAICEFLEEAIHNNSVSEDNKESLQVAIQCIAESFEIDLEKDRSELSIKPASLSAIYSIFQNTQSKTANASAVDFKKQADSLKSMGNKAMQQKNFPEAIDFYTQAISLDAENAVFYANRAAAYSQIEQHEKAVADAKSAIKVDAEYSKAYSRMGHAYFCMGKYQEAVDAYKTGLSLDPGNAAMKTSLAAANQKVGELSKTDKSAAANPLADMMSSMGGLGGAGAGGGMDFSSMMSNPNFMQMASQMMSNPAMSSMLQNPAIASMAQNLMSDPSALQNIMNNPQLASMAGNMMKNKEKEKGQEE